MPNKFSRRSFLQSSTASAVGAGLYFSSTSMLDAASSSPNEQPVVGYIGTGIRFHTALGRQATDHVGACAALADVDAVQLGRAKQVIFDQHMKGVSCC